MMRALNHSARLTTATLLALLLGAYLYGADAQASGPGENISRVNGRIEIAGGESVGNISTVNGGISLEDGVVARNISAVNGGISLGSRVETDDIDTVNGDIEIDSDARIDGTVSSVNGDIEIDGMSTVQGSITSVNGAITLDSGTEVGRDIRTANGRIRLSNSHVGGDLVTRHGDILLHEGSVVEGNIEFRDQRSWFRRLFGFGLHDEPRLVIDASSAVRGDVHLYHRVDVEIEDGAEVGDIVRHY